MFHEFGKTLIDSSHFKKYLECIFIEVNNKFFSAKEIKPPKSEVIYFSEFIRSSFISYTIHIGIQQMLSWFWLHFPYQWTINTGSGSNLVGIKSQK